VQRYQVQAPLDVTVLRSGIPDTVPGRSVNVCERGIAAMMAGELVPGEAVGIEVQLPLLADPLRTRALVKYQDRLRCGLEFIGLSAEQRAAIQDWAIRAKAEEEIGASSISAMAKKGGDASAGSGLTAGGSATRKPRQRRGWVGWVMFLVFVAIAVGVFWWRWNREWEELETGMKNAEVASAEKPQAQVPAEVMERLLVHRVEPTYPAGARRASLQGIIALDIVVGRE
jgi:hypothetical protein